MNPFDIFNSYIILQALLRSFQESIDQLTQLYSKHQKKVDKVEKQCYLIALEHEDNLKKQRTVFQVSL